MTATEEQDAREAEELERAISSMETEWPRMPENEECIQALLPQTFEARKAFAAGSEELSHILEFEREAQAIPRSYDGRLSIFWMLNTLAPILERADFILSKRREAQAQSNYVGEEKSPVTIEATVVHTQKFERDYGTKYLTLLKDDEGNRFTYWNNVNLPDGEGMDENGKVIQLKRPAVPGERVKLTATVKKHELFREVKQTVLQRARKVELLSPKS